MLPNSNSSDASHAGLANGLSHRASAVQAATLDDELEAEPASRLPIPAEPVTPQATQHGLDVLAVYARAYDWTLNERHAIMTMDHLLFAVADRQAGAGALLADGVTGVADLEFELLNLVHKAPVKALLEGASPAVDNGVLAVLNHALGYARQNGRDFSNLTDLLRALLDALRKGEPDTPGMTALRRRWPRATEDDGIKQILEKILAVQAETLERTSPAPRPWYRRLHVLLIAFGIVAVASTGLALWSLGT